MRRRLSIRRLALGLLLFVAGVPLLLWTGLAALFGWSFAEHAPNPNYPGLIMMTFIPVALLIAVSAGAYLVVTCRQPQREEG